uniref:Major facilitator superfamily (MFS) profile domain-containing protein n=1 Tax=Timema poppense TaxID=170557 RepID=A0A7R9CTB4_TIMPO|nr:unnamed protein product [Timema poppensis]
MGVKMSVLALPLVLVTAYAIDWPPLAFISSAVTDSKSDDGNDNLNFDDFSKPPQVRGSKYFHHLMNHPLLDIIRGGSTYFKQEKNDSQSLDSMDSMIAMLNRSLLRRMLSRIFVALDLGLLQDPIYINIMLGMSFAISAEINFSLMTPFILGDLGFSNDRTATIMSTLGIADLVFRFLSPFVADSLGISARTMYLISLCLLVIARTTLTFFTSFESVMVVGVGLGMAKGVRVVYMGLVIPSYVKIERLASAAGLQMVLNGIFLLMFGPIIGELEFLIPAARAVPSEVAGNWSVTRGTDRERFACNAQGMYGPKKEESLDAFR